MSALGLPEVAQNANCEEFGNLGLTEREVDDIVAWENTALKANCSQSF